MARGRMINITIAEDETFNAMSIDAQFVFMRTLPHLDRDGLITGNTTLLHSKVTPLLPEYGPKMADIIQEWIANEFVMKYQDGKKDVLFFLNFRKNQYGMRYDKEGPSTFAPPPSYKRIAAGLVPSDSTPESGSNTNNDSSHENVSTDEGRSNSVPIPLLNRKEVEEEGKDTAHAREDAEPAQTAPPFEVAKEPSATSENGYRDPLPSEYLPGLRNPKRQLRNTVTQTVADAKRFGVEPATFREMTDCLLLGCGKKSRADVNSDDGEQVLLHAQAVVLNLIQLSPNFRSVKGIESIFKSWQDNDYRGDSAPSSAQVIEHAGKMTDGKVVCERKDRKNQPAAPANQEARVVDFSKYDPMAPRKKYFTHQTVNPQ